MPQHGCVAIIAVNARARCKTRLDGLLGADGRIELARAMLSRVLAAARASPLVDEVLVVSPERDRVPADIPVLHDAGCDLNAAMEAGRSEAVARGAGALVLLPADLPLLAPRDVSRLVLAGTRGGVAIAPDRHGAGTNGLCLPSEVPLPFRFGPDSCARHVAEARRLGIRTRLVRAAGLRADLDTAEDVPAFLARPRANWGWPVAAAAS